MPRVSPVVGVVEVEKRFETHGLRLLCGGNGVFKVIGQFCGRNKNTKAGPVVTVVAKNFESGLSDSVFLEDRALLLSLRQKGNIRADCILRGFAVGDLLRRTDERRAKNENGDKRSEEHTSELQSLRHL